jgi:hypothetical protein
MEVRILSAGLAFDKRLCYNYGMDKFKYQVKLIVEVEAFDESDAWDAVQDAFGIGEELGVTVTDCEYKEVVNRARRS